MSALRRRHYYCCADSLFFILFFLLIASSYFTLPLKSALASPVREQARSNWNFDTVCRMVFIRGRLGLLYSVIWLEVIELHLFEITPNTAARRSAHCCCMQLGQSLPLYVLDQLTAGKDKHVACHPRAASGQTSHSQTQSSSSVTLHFWIKVDSVCNTISCALIYCPICP